MWQTAAGALCMAQFTSGGQHATHGSHIIYFWLSQTWAGLGALCTARGAIKMISRAVQQSACFVCCMHITLKANTLQ